MHGYEPPYHPFKYDAERHKDFKRASRHVLKNDAEESKSSDAGTHTLSSKEEDLLRAGFAAVDMDDRVRHYPYRLKV